MVTLDVPSKHHRRSIRLKDYDYTQPGAYFVTICTHRWVTMFGDIINGKIRLTTMGLVVEEEWQRTARMRPYVKLDEFVIMPNHVHGIVMIMDGRDVLQYVPTDAQGKFRSPSFGLGAIIRGFKSAATRRINRLRGAFGQPVWQRNYFEHIIRDDDALNRIREYIHHNPQSWQLDKYNPVANDPDKFDVYWGHAQ